MIYKLCIILSIALLTLSSCANNRAMQEFRTITRVEVVEPPADLFNCPQIGRIPDPETLTNQEVANFISLLYQYNKECKISLDKIEAFIERAKALNK